MSHKMLELKIKVRQLARELELKIRHWHQQTQHWLKARLAKASRDQK